MCLVKINCFNFEMTNCTALSRAHFDVFCKDEGLIKLIRDVGVSERKVQAIEEYFYVRILPKYLSDGVNLIKFRPLKCDVLKATYGRAILLRYWTRTQTRKTDLSKFSGRLADHEDREHVIPRVVYKITKTMESRIDFPEGVYLRNGDAEAVKELKEKFIRGEDPDVSVSLHFFCPLSGNKYPP